MAVVEIVSVTSKMDDVVVNTVFKVDKVVSAFKNKLLSTAFEADDVTDVVSRTISMFRRLVNMLVSVLIKTPSTGESK